MNSEHRGHGTAQPEILPPGAVPVGGEPVQPRGWYPPPPPPQVRKPRHWASAPATYTLVGINVAVYLFTLWQSHTWVEPHFQDAISQGLLCNGGAVLQWGQWWRVVSSIFVHFGWFHIGCNMWCLWNLGLLGEPLLGEFGMVLAFLLTGIAGNLLSIAVHPALPLQGGVVSAGASGAVFGIAGVLLMLLRSPLLPIPQFELKKLRRSVWYFALLNFVFDGGLTLVHTRVQGVPQIDNMAHLGGFLSGILVGLPLLPRIGAQRSSFVRRRAISFAVMAFLLLLFAWGLHAFYPPTGG